MAYQKQTWENLPNQTTPITAERLNFMESGIEGVDKGAVGEILWTNPDASIDFAEQQITLSSSDYDVLEIYCTEGKQETDDFNIILNQKVIKGYNAVLNGSSVNYETEGGEITVFKYNIYSRNFTRSTDTTYIIGNCDHLEQYVLKDNDNGYLIPLYIIGYKTELFD